MRTVCASKLSPFMSEYRGSQKLGVQISKTIHNCFYAERSQLPRISLATHALALTHSRLLLMQSGGLALVVVARA